MLVLSKKLAYFILLYYMTDKIFPVSVGTPGTQMEVLEAPLSCRAV